MMPQNTPGTPKEQLRATNILFMALTVGVLVFLVIVVALVKVNGGGFGDDEEMNKYVSMIPVVIAAVCLCIGWIGYSRRIRAVSGQNISLDEKLNHFRAAVILYLAACEGGALFSIIAIFLTGRLWLIVLIVVMLLAMFLKRPVKQRVIDDLKLNWEEQVQLD